jgi:PKHD-type hydroxylase
LLLIISFVRLPSKRKQTKPKIACLKKVNVGKIRKISLTINLNTPGEYDGGDLKFDFGEHADERFYTCEEIRPQGSVIVFPSFMPHCVTPVTRGTRYSLVLWCLGRPFV